jgi:hypothetical protein
MEKDFPTRVIDYMSSIFLYYRSYGGVYGIPLLWFLTGCIIHLVLDGNEYTKGLAISGIVYVAINFIWVSRQNGWVRCKENSSG